MREPGDEGGNDVKSWRNLAQSNLALHSWSKQAQCLTELIMTLALIAANVRAEGILAGGCLSTARADSRAAANPGRRSKRPDGDRKRWNGDLFGRTFKLRDRGGYGELEGWTEGEMGEDGQPRQPESVKADRNVIRFAVAGKVQLIGSRIDQLYIVQAGVQCAGVTWVVGDLEYFNDF